MAVLRSKFLLFIKENWLLEGGRVIIGVDHYLENKPSLNWAEENGIEFMTTLSESQWLQLFVDAGLTDLKSWRIDAKGDWAGTLALSGVLAP